jgi:TRAP-type uncharacterized transport system fused permease subunit
MRAERRWSAYACEGANQENDIMPSLPDPLHPAIVHLPIALALLVPAFALLAALAIHLKAVPSRTWIGVLLLQVALVGSGWMAAETGEEQEERVEEVVAERYIEDHEEHAERFQLAAGVALAIVAAGLVPGVAGSIARGVSVAAALAVLAAGIQVGHTGGELVYRHGAASAYATQDDAGITAPEDLRELDDEDSDDDD